MPLTRFLKFFRSGATPVILAILLVSIGTSLATYFSVSNGFARVELAQDGARTTRTLMKTLLDQETAVRGYTSTHDRVFLKPYYEADPLDGVQISSIASLLARLRLNYPGLANFIHTNANWDAAARQLIRNPDAPNARALHLRGKVLMDRMRAHDAALLSLFQGARKDAISTTKRRLVIAGAIAALSIFVLGIIGIYLEQRRRRSEAALRGEIEAHARDLERSNSALAEYAYVASHDLQEPLRMVSSYTQLLSRRYSDKLDDDAKEFIGFAYDGAKRMEALIKDLLAYSRLGADRTPFETVDTQAAFENAVANLAISVRESAASVEAEALPKVRGNRSQLELLLQNLIGNAIKYRGVDAPRVHVAARRDGQCWQFSVHDNGIGIEPEYKERIFKMFQRLHTRAEYSGTGIGLAVVKRIVEAHDGRVWVESAKGAGSTFYFTLPANT